jgi:hypothetical protein
MDIMFEPNAELSNCLVSKNGKAVQMTAFDDLR